MKKHVQQEAQKTAKQTVLKINILEVNNLNTQSDYCVVDSKLFSSFFSTIESNKNAELLAIIKAAKKSYVPCNSTNCKCHSSVIANDFIPFKDGITKIMLDNVKSK